jgi:hypothetical protein
MMDRSLCRHSVDCCWLWMHHDVKDMVFYVNLYRGQDYYNIRFDRVAMALRLGLAFNFNSINRAFHSVP